MGNRKKQRQKRLKKGTGRKVRTKTRRPYHAAEERLAKEAEKADRLHEQSHPQPKGQVAQPSPSIARKVVKVGQVRDVRGYGALKGQKTKVTVGHVNDKAILATDKMGERMVFTRHRQLPPSVEGVTNLGVSGYCVLSEWCPVDHPDAERRKPKWRQKDPEAEGAPVVDEDEEPDEVTYVDVDH